jgi:hypothetical protein
MLSSSSKCPFSIILSASSMTRNRKPRILSARSVSYFVNFLYVRRVTESYRFDKVPQPTRCRNENVHASVNDSLLLVYAQSSHETAYANTGYSLGAWESVRQ